MERRSNNPQPGDSPPELERAVEAAAEALAAANPTPGPAASPLLNGSWALLYSGRSRRLAAGAAFPASSGAAPSLREALQAASDAAYSAFYRYVPVLAGSAVGRARGSSASNVQVSCAGRAAVDTLHGSSIRTALAPSLRGPPPLPRLGRWLTFSGVPSPLSDMALLAAAPKACRSVRLPQESRSLRPWPPRRCCGPGGWTIS